MSIISSLTTLWSDRITRAGWLVSLSLIAALIVLLVWFIPPSTGAQALHYNIYFGIDLFGPGRALWLHPTAAGLVLIINSCVAVLALERQVVAARLAVWSAALFAAIVLAATILISLVP